MPLNTRFKAREAGFVLQKSRARVLFTCAEFLGTRYVDMLANEYGGPLGARPFAGLPALERVITIDGALDAFVARGQTVPLTAAMARAHSVLPDHLSDIMFTSGTTGEPKGVMTTHGQNTRAFTAWSEAVGLRKGDRYLIVSPFFHSFGWKAGCLACLLTGATMLPHAAFDASRILERLRREAITVLPGPPTLYQSLLDHPQLRAAALPPLRLAVTGAAVVPVELIARMRRELGFRTVITGYGLTESCGMATMCRATDDDQTIARTSGRAIEGVELRVVDGAGNSLPAGEPGEVLLRGYNVMRGYFELPEATREAIDAEGFLHTGDIGVLDDRGNLRITDRRKDMYIAGGFNCYPAEIERIIATHPQVAQVAVIGVPDRRMGEVGMAFVVPRSGRLDRDALAEFCRHNLANYKVPRSIVEVAELPLNASGKVVKERLRERAGRPDT